MVVCMLGWLMLDVELCIVGLGGELFGLDEIGEIWVCGYNVMYGYFK